MNKIIIAAAGAGKTETIVREAFNKSRSGKVLITTYTDENTQEIITRFYKLYHGVPLNVQIIPWYTFLLRFLIKPFQNLFIPQNIKGVLMTNKSSAPYKSKSSKEFYISSDDRIYSDKAGALSMKFMSDFNGFPLQNLCSIFSTIFVDEMQDMGSYDIDVVKSLLQSPASVTCVCDPRQSTFFTANGQKNKSKKGINLRDSFVDIDVEIDETSLNTNHRCHHQITSFSNKLYPDFAPAMSDTDYIDSHLGLYFVRPKDIDRYIQEFKPMQLRERISSPYFRKEYPVMNIGIAKGKTFDRTLLFLPKTHINWICNERDLEDKSKALLYVALTRARFSAAIVYDYPHGFKHPIISNYEYLS